MKKIGILTSGGDAPGMNAAIRAVVRTAVYHNLEVFGIHRGFEGMIEGDIFPMNKRDVGNIIHRGVTVLKTARSKRFRTPEGRKEAYASLQEKQIEQLETFLIQVGRRKFLTPLYKALLESGYQDIALALYSSSFRL